MTNREIIENALKRVNALAGTKGKLYRDNTGWYIVNKDKSDGVMRFDESSRSAGELIAYLHGVEDTLNYYKEK
jgi:hypothetical protein